MISRFRQEILFIGMLCATAVITGYVYLHLNWKYVLYKRAEQQLAHQQFNSAAELYRQAIEKGLTIPNAYLHLADAYTAEHQFDKAVDIYRYYLALYPNDKEARIKLARVLSYLGAFQESTEEYEKAIEEKQSRRKPN